MQNVWHLYATKILHCVKATKLFCCYLVPTCASNVTLSNQSVCVPIAIVFPSRYENYVLNNF